MEGNKIELYKDMIHDLNKEIHVLSNEFNTGIVTNECLIAIGNLEIKIKDYIKLCKEIKSNPDLYTKEDLLTIRKEETTYKDIILKAKKILTYFHNKYVFDINYMYETIRDVLSKQDNNTEKLDLFTGIKLPEYYLRDINNYQDRLVIDFAKLDDFLGKLGKIMEKLNIHSEMDTVQLELDYIEEYQIPKLEEYINKIGNDNKYTKVSVRNDIFFLIYQLEHLSRLDKEGIYFERINNLNQKISLLKDNLSKKNNNKDNPEYYHLKEKLDIFLSELEDYYDKLKFNNEELSDEKLKEINEEYIGLEELFRTLPEKVKTDKTLNDNLYNYLVRIKEQVNLIIEHKKVEMPEEKVEEKKEEASKKEETPPVPARTSSEPIDEDYTVSQVRDGSKAYKYYGKAVLISSALATLVLLSPGLAPFVIPAIIAGNMTLASAYPVMNKINSILFKKTDIKRGKDGKLYDSLGNEVTRGKALQILLKTVVINGEGKPKIVTDIVNKIKSLGDLTPSKEYLQTMKEKRDNENKAMLAKLYKEYVKSGRGFRKFCETHMLSEPIAGQFANYIIKNGSKSKKETTDTPSKGRGK